MKRVLIFFLLALLFAAGVSGCGSSENDAAKKSAAPGTGAPKLKIVTTIFPEYSWTKELLGSREKDTELTLLAKKGADMHSYQPRGYPAHCGLRFVHLCGRRIRQVGGQGVKAGGQSETESS